MTTLTRPETTATPAARLTGTTEPVVALKRRTIDSVLIAVGGIVTVAFVVAAALLTWGSNFASDYVNDELSSQNIAFPPAAVLQDQGRTDLVKYADEKVNTGPEAEAYASFINGHLQGIADGATYADLGTPERAATAAVDAAKADGSNEDYEDFMAKLGAGTPLKRLGTAEEFAAMACFLVSEQAGYINGTAINVDGGASPVV